MTAIPFAEDTLNVSDGHRLYVAQYGNPAGPAAVVLHGGPASASQPSMSEWFDLTKQRVVLYDQRGAGKSAPLGRIEANTTAYLVADLEAIRMHLQIDRWIVVGGSWGAMLALAYLGAHPSSIRATVLRGTFLPTALQLDWFFQQLQALVPDGWQALVANMNQVERQTVLSSLTNRLLHGTPEQALDAAKSWAAYEDAVVMAMRGASNPGGAAPAKPDFASAAATSGSSISPNAPSSSAAPATNAAMASDRMLHKYRVQAHYLMHHAFVSERQLFRAARKTSAPLICLHGTHDWICPPVNAMRLKRFVPHAELRWIAGGTHLSADPLVAAALRQAIADVFNG